MKPSNEFLKDLFSLTIITFAVGMVFKLLESVFSKDDGVLNKESTVILSNSVDKKKILEAASESRDNEGKVQKVILSNDKVVEISA